MHNNQRQIAKIIKQICLKNHYPLNSYANDWIFEIAKNKKLFYIVGYDFPLDNHSIKKLCDDKSALYETLHKHRIPAVEHFYFITPKNSHWIGQNDYVIKMQRLLQQYKKLVIKPNIGTAGDFVNLVSNEKELKKYSNELFNMNKDVTLSPYYNIQNEYRVVMLQNKPTIVFNKIRKNNWKHNLGLGAISKNLIEKTTWAQLTDLAKKVTTTLDIVFASVDIVQVNNELKVLEINSGVMLENYALRSKINYQKVFSLYSKCIKLM